jgi:hypothetical protein
MLKSLREITGCTGGAKSARERAAALRKELADEREKAREWCFSRPMIRPGSIEQTMLSVFTIQGNGTLHACDKLLTESDTRKLVTKAELNLALLELPKIKLLGFIGDGKLRAIDATSLAEKSTWAPPTASPTQSLTAANKQFWWATEAGVYALEAADDGTLRLASQSGQPFSGRQVGRIKQPTLPYSGVNPNDLFDTMNIHAWIRNRATQTDPLTAGMLSQLMLSDASGKYTSPPEGSSYVIHGPFERDAQSAASSWTHMKAHPSRPLVLLTDSRGGSVLCRYPAANSLSQLVPVWYTAPWLYSVTPYSALDTALRKDWPPAPTARALTKPHKDMVAQLRSLVPANSPLAQAFSMVTWAPFKVRSGREFGDRDLRTLFWFALHDRSLSSDEVAIYDSALNTVGREGFKLLFDSAAVKAFRDRFGAPGTSWDCIRSSNAAEAQVFASNFFNNKDPLVNYDPPWVWKTPPALYHSRPPLWIDPWGYNNPGDFISQQPSPTYLDPFCFDGNLRFPQRPVTFNASFRGRRWATFTDNDPASLLASGKPALPPTLRADDTTDPSALVLTVDEDRQRATFQVLPPKPVRITFEAATHSIKNEAQDVGWINQQVVAPPLVYKDAAETFPTAWCVTNPEYPGVRLRRLAEVSTSGTSQWDTFIATYRTQHGPITAWKIDVCPLPEIALPLVSLNAYGLPVS